MNNTRIEKDSLGEVSVPAQAYYGAQTKRASDNFPISGWRFGRSFIKSLGLIKWAASKVNEELGLIDGNISAAIQQAAEEVIEGKHDDHFILDIFQTGSGTSTNMNANEVISNRAIEILGGNLGSKEPVHPNDHVNKCQSSNDVIPTATHLAALMTISENLLPSLDKLRGALASKADEFEEIVKSGRTHLMDATPVTLGQEFSGFTSQIEHGLARLAGCLPHLSELALGGTAVGTGINAHEEFAPRVIDAISKRIGIPLVEAPNHFEAQGARDAVVEASGVMKTIAISLARIASDIRLMASGPRTGLAEIKLPAIQPGSSIMPGKVNPVIPEAVIQVAAQVVGNDQTIALGGLGSYLELNTMMPVMAHNLINSIDLLANVSEVFATKCVTGIEADEVRSRELLERSPAIITALVPLIGYDAAAEIFKESLASGRNVREILVERQLIDNDKLEQALDLRTMTQGGLSGNSGE